MSTRSSVGFWIDLPEGKFKSTYVHSDGYISHRMVQVLDGIKKLGTSQFIERMIANGALSSIGEDFTLPPVYVSWGKGHSFNTRQKYYEAFQRWLEGIKNGTRQIDEDLMKNLYNNFTFEISKEKKTAALEIHILPDEDGQKDPDHQVMYEAIIKLNATLSSVMDNFDLSDDSKNILEKSLAGFRTLAKNYTFEESDPEPEVIVIYNNNPDYDYYQYWACYADKSFYARGEDGDIYYDDFADLANSDTEYAYLVDIKNNNLWVFARYQDGLRDEQWGNWACLIIIDLDNIPEFGKSDYDDIEDGKRRPSMDLVNHYRTGGNKIHRTDVELEDIASLF